MTHTKDPGMLTLKHGRWGGALPMCEAVATTPPAQPAQPVQEPVAWPCVIAEADFEQDTITLKMQCSDYKVGAGQHWLHTTTPPAQPEPVQEPTDAWFDKCFRSDPPAALVPLTEPELRAVLKKTNHMIENTMCGPFWPELEQACRAIEAAHGITEKGGAA
jgi:hypothetical protein